MAPPELRQPHPDTRVPRRLAAAQQVLKVVEGGVPPRLRTPLRYAVALALVAVTALLQDLLHPDPALAPFALFFVAAAVTAFLGGRGPGLACVLLSAAVANHRFIAPYDAWSTRAPALAATATFVASAACVSLLAALFRDALLDAAQSTTTIQEQLRLVEEAQRARQETETASRAQSREFGAILEAVPAPIWMAHDREGRSITGNRAAYDVAGIPAGEGASLAPARGAGPSYQVLRGGRPLGDGELPVQVAARTGQRVPAMELELVRPDGTRRHLLGEAIPLFDAAGAPRGALGAFVDITDRKRAEEDLRRADQAKSEFLGVLSHELRNPLAPLLNAVYILRRAEPGSAQRERALAVVERQARQLSRLTDDLLDVTRVARGKIRLARERVELRALVQRVVEDHQPVFDVAGVRLELALEPEPPLFVYADPARVTQILGNLLQNAVKFTARGGWTRVSARAEADGFAALRVSDDGAGLAPELRERLFEPFVQADRTLARAGGGLGLGLALVKGLAQLHGGDVTAESAGLGRGATFTVRLPLDRRRAPRLSLVAPAAPARAALRVLLVEDDLDAASTLREALELEGYRVEIAHAGPQALAAARAAPPDAVVCDLGLPGMSGFEVARALRADPRLSGIRLVALSGYANPDDVERSLEAGFDVHLAKPPDIELLERSLHAPEDAAAPPQV